MALSIQSAVYQKTNAHPTFDGGQHEQGTLNSHQQDYRNNVPVQPFASSPQHIVSCNLNAAIASSLKLNKSSSSLKIDSSLKLFNNFLSFHPSPATPLDTLIKAHIEKMPNSTVLLNPTSVKNLPCAKAACLFSDSELIKCCKDSQSALPRINLGFRNAGNTCYLNSVLQCILATGALLRFVREKHSKPGVCVYANSKNGRRFCVLCALFRLLQEHSQQNNHSVVPQSNNDFLNRISFGSTTPSSFAANVRAVCPNLRVYAQEDAHEYLLGLLSRMEDSVISGVGKIPRSTLDTNVIRRIFSGVTRSEVTCSTCHKVSPRNDQWFNLSMDITHARSLQQCLVNHALTEILQGANAYKCETCQQLRHAKRCSRIFRAPPILIVQFNRFSRNQKLDYHVYFPASFNMRPYMTPSIGPPVIYHLYATLNHEGLSCRTGHYVAFSKRRDQWFSHNDSTVVSTTQEYVLRQTPYLLFYQLASPEEVLVHSSVGGNDGHLQSDAKSVAATSVLTSPSPGSSRGLLSKVESIDVSSIPLPSGPNRPKPAIIFHPRVLCKPTPLAQSLSVEASVTKASGSHVSSNGDTSALAKVNGVPSPPLPSKSWSLTTKWNASPSRKTPKVDSLKPLNGVTNSWQEIPSNYVSTPSKCLQADCTDPALNCSSSSVSTEGSVEWVAVTKNDLICQLQNPLKRSHVQISGNKSSSLNNGVPSLSKFSRKESNEAANCGQNRHHRRSRKAKNHKRKHRHRKHRHKRSSHVYENP